jgi:light-regulated signal transduction histidine kinase (bacteriophytochrome)
VVVPSPSDTSTIPAGPPDAQVTLETCAREPIHIPGSIQPHGVLFTCAQTDLAIRQVSANVAAWLGADANALLGTSFSSLLEPGSAAALAEALTRPVLREANPLRFQFAAGRALDAILHRSGDTVVIELERRGGDGTRASGFDPRLRSSILRMQHARSVEAICQVAAEEVRTVTGFDRVMVYRFDADWKWRGRGRGSPAGSRAVPRAALPRLGYPGAGSPALHAQLAAPDRRCVLRAGAARPGPRSDHRRAVRTSAACSSAGSASGRSSCASSLPSANDQLIETDRIKDAFIATVGHELRTPLSAITGWIEMLQGGNVGPDRIAQAYAVIARNAEKQIVDDLLDVSRIASGKVSLEVVSVELPALVESVLETATLSITAKGLRLKKILDSTATPVLGDPARLRQIISNLVTNAVKFTPKDGAITIEPAVPGAGPRAVDRAQARRAARRR